MEGQTFWTKLQEKAMNFARNSKKHQKLVYFAKKNQIQENQIAKLRRTSREKGREKISFRRKTKLSESVKSV